MSHPIWQVASLAHVEEVMLGEHMVSTGCDRSASAVNETGVSALGKFSSTLCVTQRVPARPPKSREPVKASGPSLKAVCSAVYSFLSRSASGRSSACT